MISPTRKIHLIRPYLSYSSNLEWRDLLVCCLLACAIIMANWLLDPVE